MACLLLLALRALRPLDCCLCLSSLALALAFVLALAFALGLGLALALALALVLASALALALGLALQVSALRVLPAETRLTVYRRRLHRFSSRGTSAVLREHI